MFESWRFEAETHELAVTGTRFWRGRSSAPGSTRAPTPTGLATTGSSAASAGTDSVYLPLRAGRNELVMAVSENFGGWGVQAKLADLEGVSLED
ncbi:MAG: hypothetical protein ACRDQ2_06595 [Gaiellales bacterium]